MSIASLSDKTATFERKATAADALGLGHNETFSTAYSGVSIALQPANGRTVEQFAREGFQVNYMAYTATPMTLLSGDRMSYGGAYYRVQGPQRDMGGRGRAYSIPLLLKDE